MAPPRVLPLDEQRALELIGAVVAAAEAAHTERTLVERVGRALAARTAIAHVELTSPLGAHHWAAPGSSPVPMTGAFTRELLDLGERGSMELVFAVDGAASPSPLLASEALRRTLAGVLRASLGQIETLRRVAALSKRAHGERETFREELASAAIPHDVVAVSPVMKRLFGDTLPLVAREDVTVLLRGETGTGKEVVARRLHALSRRARRPLVTVNCGALPDPLAESVLFGHERGAFTGATARHVGLFERANGATLFLDEVGELSPAIQARLLRVLESGEVVRVGGVATLHVDVRIVAATHRALGDMVRGGTFREDLFYRLAVVPIDLPPLRERKEDVEPLTRAIVSAAAARMGRTAPPLRPSDLARLLSWPWPGNVRELRNVLERALVLSRGDDLELPEDWDRASTGIASAPSDGPAAPPEPERFDDAQRRILADALAACEGRVYGADGAAARLGLRPTTLQSKLERLGLVPARPGRASRDDKASGR